MNTLYFICLVCTKSCFAGGFAAALSGKQADTAVTSQEIVQHMVTPEVKGKIPPDRWINGRNPGQMGDPPPSSDSALAAMVGKWK